MRSAIWPSIILGALAVASAVAEAQPDSTRPATSPVITPEQGDELGRLSTEYQQLYAAAKYAEALVPARRLSRMIKDLLGEQTPEYATSLNNLAVLYKAMNEYAKAEALYLQVLQIKSRMLGEQHPSYAASLINLASLYQATGDYAKAEPLLVRAMQIDKQALGEHDPDYAACLDYLAELYQAMGDYAKAEPLYLRGIEIKRQTLGERHPDYAASLNNLAALYKAMGDYAKAEPLLVRAMQICKQASGEHHPDYATCLSNLAVLYQAMGEYAKAEPLLVRAMEIDKQALGEQQPSCATDMDNLASLYKAMGDYAKAEPLIVRAMQIDKQALGERHPVYAMDLNSLAVLYYDLGANAKAEPLFLEALRIFKLALGEHNPDYAASLNNLALLYEQSGDYSKAEPLYLQAKQIREEALGEHHPDFAASLNNLAGLYLDMGDYAKAEPLYLQAVQIDKKALGEKHVDYASDLNNLADLYRDMGDDARAEPLCRQALDIVTANLELSAAVQSERQQTAMVEKERRNVSAYLSLAATTRPALAYDRVLCWKGGVGLRQRQIRTLHDGANNPAVAQLHDELLKQAQLLSRLSRTTPDDATLASPKRLAAWQQKLSDLGEQVEKLQRDLARIDGQYRETLAQTRRTSQELAAALPPGAVLVDVREYNRSIPRKEKTGTDAWQRSLVAFVVRHGEAVARVDLGPAEPVDSAVATWRGTDERSPRLGTGASAVKAGADLRRLVWERLLQQAPRQMSGATTVLFSPDGALCRFPISAMPGSDPGTYLIEDIAIATVPVPSALPNLLSSAPEQAAAHPSLLVMGNVDYDHASTSPPSGGPTPTPAMQPVLVAARGTPSAIRAAPGHSDEPMHWNPLAGTGGEADDVEKLFRSAGPHAQLARLSGAGATEAAFRRLAPQYRYLHLATHGFFSPESVRSASAPATRPISPAFALEIERPGFIGYYPGLLSGIVFAGANAPRPGEDDGILTAMSVEEMDLSQTDLAVLSACETGLGARAGGEGLVGLQRAFQIAGAKSVVASLWSIDDDASRQLMRKFYENLWQKKMSKLAALREAQLWVMHGGLNGNRSVARPTTNRSFGQPTTVNSTRTEGRVDPRYWAAFVLSGDWR